MPPHTSRHTTGDPAGLLQRSETPDQAPKEVGMRVFVAGGTGAIGRRVVAGLVAAGHGVAATTRSDANANAIEDAGASAVVVDVYDRDALETRLVEHHPDVVIHQLTDLPDDVAHIGAYRDANDRIRREGTANLVAAARAAGVRSLIAQSVAWEMPEPSAAAVADLERQVGDFGGLVVRYGRFYGPDTFFSAELPPPPRIHIDDAARRTIALLGHPAGVVTLADESDEPATER